MVRKIFKSGNSIVVSIPKEMLDSLNMAEGAEVDVEFDELQKVITIAPTEIPVRSVDETFARQIDEFILQYRPALEALARA